MSQSVRIPDLFSADDPYGRPGAQHIVELPDGRVVAFLDMLGFGQLVLRMKDDPKFFRLLLSCLQKIAKVEADAAPTRLEVTSFSDSIVVSIPRPDPGSKGSDLTDLYIFLQRVIGLARDLLFLGVLLRGGISWGRTHHREKVGTLM